VEHGDRPVVEGVERWGAQRQQSAAVRRGGEGGTMSPDSGYQFGVWGQSGDVASYPGPSAIHILLFATTRSLDQNYLRGNNTCPAIFTTIRYWINLCSQQLKKHGLHKDN
jgi:hypothetical protein